MPKTKKFIDRKHSVKFQLVQRSQQDPLVVDDTAPQHVLQPILKTQHRERERDKRIEEQKMFGIPYEDDGEYLTHLKDRSDNVMEWPKTAEEQLEQRLKKLQLELPKEVFPSEVEANESLVSRPPPSGGLQVHLDPELQAAMEEDFDLNDPENQLDDDFIDMADGVASDQEFDLEFERGADSDDEGSDCLSFNSSENHPKTAKSYYSMISTVTRTEHLDLLDARFERLLDKEYGGGEMGNLDDDESSDEEPLNPEAEKVEAERIATLIQQIEKWTEDERPKIIERGESLTNKTMELVRNMEETDDSETDDCNNEEENDNKKEAVKMGSDCGSNQNRPKLLPFPGKIEINERTGLPKISLNANKLTARNLSAWNDHFGPQDCSEDEDINDHHSELRSRISQVSYRPPDESIEAKRLRKKAVKELKQERRIEKKANREAFLQTEKQEAKIRRSKAKAAAQINIF